MKSLTILCVLTILVDLLFADDSLRRNLVYLGSKANFSEYNATVVVLLFPNVLGPLSNLVTEIKQVDITQISTDNQQCGGVLLRKDVVLTAAHCLANQGYSGQPFDAAYIRVSAMRGDWVLTPVNELYEVSHYVLYQGYQYYKPFQPGDSYGRDVALLFLKTSVIPTPFVPIATDLEVNQFGLLPLPIVSMAATGNNPFKKSPFFKRALFKYNQNVSTSGWREMPPDCFVGDLYNFPNEQPYLTNACNGDSGSPIYADLNGVKKLIGVASLADCDNPNPLPLIAIYANLYASWFNRMMRYSDENNNIILRKNSIIAVDYAPADNTRPVAIFIPRGLLRLTFNSSIQTWLGINYQDMEDVKPTNLDVTIKSGWKTTVSIQGSVGCKFIGPLEGYYYAYVHTRLKNVTPKGFLNIFYWMRNVQGYSRTDSGTMTQRYQQFPSLYYTFHFYKLLPTRKGFQVKITYIDKLKSVSILGADKWNRPSKSQVKTCKPSVFAGKKVLTCRGSTGTSSVVIVALRGRGTYTIDATAPAAQIVETDQVILKKFSLTYPNLNPLCSFTIRRLKIFSEFTLNYAITDLDFSTIGRIATLKITISTLDSQGKVWIVEQKTIEATPTSQGHYTTFGDYAKFFSMSVLVPSYSQNALMIKAEPINVGFFLDIYAVANDAQGIDYSES